MPRTFVILAMPRTGSQHLCSLVDSHPHCIAHGELFNPVRVGMIRGALSRQLEQYADRLCPEARTLDPAGFLRFVLGFDRSVAQAGYKHFLDHHQQMMKRLIADHEVLKILLTRENLLASYSSRGIALATGRAHHVRTSKLPVPSETVPFRARAFSRHRRTYENRYREVRSILKQSGSKYLELEYRRLNTSNVRNQLFDFLGVEREYPVLTRLSKINDNDIAARFTDPDSVLRYLRSIDKLDWAVEDVSA